MKTWHKAWYEAEVTDTSSTEAMTHSIRKEGERLIIEPFKKRSLLELLATLPDIDEDFPNVDEGLVPLDDIFNLAIAYLYI